ncbi:DUF3570 domain-containing protein [Algibacillus agarilyticus]|uniref:DUF3570 domain-containing protein n=1 Tax=Algibacillus agarilyticus TaxID=2234133 RepID=UPI001E2B5493|nr:DUF3570 domain-containing protein [Algibacillus agarilyticus]
MGVINRVLSLITCCLFLLFLPASQAAVLDDDRADVLYHSYEGGGMKIDGPAVLVRKKAGESVALSAYYYVDTISSASVDVMSTASPYIEERKEGQLGIELLNDKTIMALNYRQSEESDFLASSVSFDVSHDTFGDLTNLAIGLTYGDNEIRRNGDETFLEQSEQYRIRASISQILTRNLTASINIEGVADQGYLNNPYRTVRFIDEDIGSGVGYQAEVYPNTRNSFAAKLSASYFLPWHAALLGHYRQFTDSWAINARDIELVYRQPIFDLELEIKGRHYQQTQADFYQDLFPYRNAQNFLARDKELSDFNDKTIGMSLTYILPEKYSFEGWHSEFSLQWDHIVFAYNNFRDPTADAAVGEEPLYTFSANVIRAFVSINF